MLKSGKEYYTRFSPAEITQITFSFEPNPILNKEYKIIPRDEKLHKKFRKKWKFFSRILLRRFTVRFSKELYRVSLTVIQLRNYYMRRNLKRWYLRFKWSKMAHQIHKINYIQQIKTRYLSLKEKNKRKSPNQLKWKTMSRLLITSSVRSRLYSELNMLIKERKMKQIAKWNELCKKLRPINLQNIQKSYAEKRHVKYVYRKFFLRWLLKYRSKGDSIKYIFKVEYPEMLLATHINSPFEFDSYSSPFTKSSISNGISLLKDVYDFNEELQNRELENLPDLFEPEIEDNSKLAKNAFNNSYSHVLSFQQIVIPEIVIDSIYDDFNDMQKHLFSNEEQLNLSVSSSLSYFQSCPQFQIKNDIESDVSLSMDEISKDNLSSLKNYTGKIKSTNEHSNVEIDIPLQLSNISEASTRSLTQFKTKPSIKEQKTQVNIDVDLDEIKKHIGFSSLTNFKHIIKKKPNPKIKPEVPLSFQDICNRSTFTNLKDYVNVTLPNSSNAENINVDIVFIDEVEPIRRNASGVSSIDFFESKKDLNTKENDDENNSDDDISISIDLELSDVVPSLHPNESLYQKNQKSKNNNHTVNSSTIEEIIPFSGIDNSSIEVPNVKDANKLRTKLVIRSYNPNLYSTVRYLKNYQIEVNEKDFYFIIDENDLWLAPDYSLIIKQPEMIIQRMNNVGPTLKLLMNHAIEEEEYALFEEEEEEVDDINVDSIDFDCLSPLYLDVPSDILNSISQSTKLLDSSSLIHRDPLDYNVSSLDILDSSFNYHTLIEKSRYPPYLFQLPSKTILPLYLSQCGRERYRFDQYDYIVNKATKDPSSIMSKTRYTPSFLNMYPPMIDNILRISHTDRSAYMDDIEFDIRPKVIHTNHFLSTVKSSIFPFIIYQGKPDIQNQKVYTIPRIQLPKVRYTPHIFTIVSSTLSPLDSFQSKKKQLLPCKEKPLEAVNKNDQIEKKTIKKRTIIRRVKKRGKSSKNHNVNENDNDNITVDEITSKQIVKETVRKTVFVPMQFDDYEEYDQEQEQDQVENESRVMLQSKNNSMRKAKPKSKKNKRRAASAKSKKNELPGNSILTYRKYIINADEPYDYESEANQSNVNVSVVNESTNSKRPRKSKRRGNSVTHVNSPKKSNPI